MRCRYLGLVGTVAVPAAAVATSLALVPVGATLAAPRSAAVVTAVSPAASGHPTVLLINGDSLSVPAGGAGAGPGGIATTGGGLAGSVLSLGLGGKHYDIPAAALPYVGRGLDASLFQVSLLAGREAGGRLPVRVAYRRGRPLLPGVTVTRAAGGVADGYLTASSARRFGAALVRQFLADHARGSYGQDGLFGGGVTVSLAGVTATRAASARPQARPGFALHTLTIAGTNLAGQPDTGDPVFVFNADNTARFGDFNENLNFFDHGTARFSVPPGHYWALGDFIDVSAKGKPAAERMVMLPQFTVSGDRSVRLAEQAADSRVAVLTPRPSVIKGTGFELRRLPRTGQVLTFFAMEPGAFPLWVSPTSRRPTAGTLQAYTDQWRASPSGAAAPYEYDLAYGSRGIIPRQDRVARLRGLAVVRARYYSDVRSPGDVAPIGLFRPQYQDGLSGATFLVRMPRVQTEYVTGNPAVTWWPNMGQYSDMRFGISGVSGGQFGGPQVYRAGERVTRNWDAYPLHTATDTLAGSAFSSFPLLTAVPSASREGDILRLDVTPFSDSNGHAGQGFSDDTDKVTGSYQIDQDGKKIAAGRSDGIHLPSWVSGFWQVKLSPKPSLVRFTVNAARTQARYPLSTRTRTVWTWRSAHDAGGTLPAPWQCSRLSKVNQAPSRDCAVQPMMTLSYHVAGLALNESTRPGRQVLDVTAGHLPLARQARVTGATVEVSLDNGRTWRHALVTSLGGGHYRAVYTVPAGRDVTLRVSASDAARGQITETVNRAYRVAAARPGK